MLLYIHLFPGVNAGLIVRIDPKHYDVVPRIEADIFARIPDGHDRNQTLELLKEIGALEESGAEAIVTSCGSIFIGLYCPNRQSLEILQNKLDNGQLKKDIVNWLDIEQMRQKYNLNWLNIEVDLTVLGKSQWIRQEYNIRH